jgi:hypothetical protein
MVIGVVVLAVLATLAVVLALAPSWAPQMFEGFGVGIGLAAAMSGLMWAMTTAGMRHGHRLYLRELAKVAAVAQ